MIRVQALSKRFLEDLAVDSVSFEANKGDILGFLGPNGAGKTTTMRILAGFLRPTAGTAELAGFDVVKSPLDVRRKIGYLPESIPLYPEMRVTEYLDYRARLKGVSRAARSKGIDEVLQRCGLTDVRRRIVGQLSKGYRQRVGLADALVHKPPILILDEPTVGLDPNQIRDVRKLIRELGKQHTIILSTHILPEVEAICGRVIIIKEGRVVAQDTPSALRAQVEGRKRVRVEARGEEGAVRGVLEKIEGIQRLEGAGTTDSHAAFLLEAQDGRDLREEVARALQQGGFGLREIHAEAPSLEDVFREVTMSEAQS